MWANQGAFAVNSNFRLDLAKRLANENKIESAIEEYKKYLGENPQSPQVYHELATLRIKQQKYKLAIFNLQTALKQNPDFIDAQEALATTYEKIGDTGRALAEWRKLATVSSNTFLKNSAEKHIADLMAGSNSGPASEKTGKKSDEKKPTSPVSGQDKKDVPRPLPAVLDGSGKNTEINEPLKVENTSGDKKNTDTLAGTENLYQQKNFLKAEELIEKEEYKKALTEIGQVLKQYNGHPGAYYLAGVARYKLAQFNRAAINFKNGLKYPSKGYKGYFYLGRIYENQGEKKKALEAFNRYVSLTSLQSEKQQGLEHIARLQSIKAHESEGFIVEDNNVSHAHVKALPYGKCCRFLVPDSASGPASRFLEAYSFLQEGRPETSINTLKKIILEYGGSSAARYAGLNLASIYYQLKLHNNVLQETSEFLAASKSDKTDAYAKYLRALALMELNQVEQSKKALSNLKPQVEYGPSQKEIFLALSNTYRLLKDYPKAISQMRKAGLHAESELEKANFNYKLAELYMVSGQPSKAVSLLQRATVLCADTSMRLVCASAYVRLADVLFKQNQWKTALKYYNLLEAQYPKYKEVPWSLYQIGNIYMKKGDYKLAMENFRNLMSRYPDNYWSAQAKWKQEDAIWQSEYKEVLY